MIKKMGIALAALAALWVSNRVGHTSGFDDGWRYGRCHLYVSMIDHPDWYGFDFDKMHDTERDSLQRACYEGGKK